MGITRYQTIGAVVPDLGTLSELAGRLEEAGIEPSSLVAITRRKDAELTKVALPEAEVRITEHGLSRAQWLELGSAYLGVTAVSVLMGAVHLLTGVIVQLVMTIAVVAGLFVYTRSPRLAKTVTALGLPEQVARRWEEAANGGFALALVVVPEELFDGAQDAFLEDDALEAVLAVDRRPVL